MNVYRVTDVLSDTLDTAKHWSSKSVALKQAKTINSRWVQVHLMEYPSIGMAGLIRTLDGELIHENEELIFEHKELDK